MANDSFDYDSFDYESSDYDLYDSFQRKDDADNGDDTTDAVGNFDVGFARSPTEYDEWSPTESRCYFRSSSRWCHESESSPASDISSSTRSNARQFHSWSCSNSTRSRRSRINARFNWPSRWRKSSNTRDTNVDARWTSITRAQSRVIPHTYAEPGAITRDIRCAAMR